MKPWNEAEAGKTDIEQLVYLSNLIGSDRSLVQRGGGNTSVKLTEPDLFGRDVQALVVKGSGTDLRTIDAAGFTHLYTDRLALLRNRDAMSDEEMMAAMRACTLFPDRDPVPSVETPLHALLPARFVAHTHDVATLSLTDTPHAEKNTRRVFGDEITFLEYVRPGFPLAKRLAERLPDGPPEGAIALTMEKHGLAVWGETARECYENLRAVIEKAAGFVAEARKGKRAFGVPSDVGAQGLAPLPEDERRKMAAALLPVIRGELARGGWLSVLHLDHSPETLEAISAVGFADLASRGVMTPEHILRAGVRPLVVTLDTDRDVEASHPPKPLAATQAAQPTVSPRRSRAVNGPPPQHHADQIRHAIQTHRDEYAAYAKRHGHEPIPDFLKTILIPGVGIIYAGSDKRAALVAADCYQATMEVIVGAEAVEKFEFISEAAQAEMEYWPLERRKIEQASRRDLDGKIALVIGAASGIGRATTLRFAAEGAHVVAADLDGEGAKGVAGEINEKAPQRALGLAVDVSDSETVAAAVREAVLDFGGIDVLFYSPGVGPEYHSVVDMPEDEVEQKMAVHYRGAVAAAREVARVMVEQRSGGRLVYNASKAAFAPGEGFAAYGASKAALVHYVRNVANELGRDGITANYINADAIDTPMFRNLVRLRAERANVSEKEMLDRYSQRSVLCEPLVPPEAVAEAALWLASDRSAHTTGCVITVGGGTEGFPR
jgi:rhamnose utilization protein RhaD (predicted bifunctional aldolase and dehydrogenase)/NAD(P)-dependent dehydrogenase (short-subunit alcohol dehydrogenase family)